MTVFARISVSSSLRGWLLRYWREPLAPVEKTKLDCADSVAIHRRIIENKPLLREVYRAWYAEYAPALKATEYLSPLIAVELGSGAGISAKYYPDLLRTDVVESPTIDRIASAEALPFKDGSLRALLMLDVLHHIPNPRRFFCGATRTLAPGGRVLMVEPTNSFLSRLILGKLHPSEQFDPGVEKWESAYRGRQSEANMAIPWVIFVRDREKFEREFPQLKIRSVRRHTMLAYCLTGGLSFRAFLPYRLGMLWLWFERKLVTLFPSLATMMTVELERVDLG